MWHEPSLVLVPDVPEHCAPQVEDSVALLAAELGPFGRLAHGDGVHLGGAVQSLQPVG